MLHLAFQDSNGNGVPSPVDGKGVTEWPLQTWLKYAPIFSAYGGTVMVMPPLTKGATLGTGYDPYDHYDLGSKNQSGRHETRYGSIELARHFVAGIKALGGECYVNVVHHHVDGDAGDWKYRYLGADGKTKNGRFPKDENCFWVWSPQEPQNPDTVADPTWDLGFGREFRWLSGTYGDGKGSNGPGYVMRGLADALDNQTRRLDISGYFHDDAKGTAPGYIGYACSQGSMAGKVAFAEYSDGNTNTLVSWMNRPEIHGMCGVMDFALRYKIRDVCNRSADMRSILSEGVCWSNPTHAITFIEDIDTAKNDPIVWSKLLGYAMLLTMPGYPMIFFEDLFIHGPTQPLLNLVWFHETFAKGDTVWRSADWDHLVYERMGDSTSSGCIVGVTKTIGSYSNPHDWKPIRVQTKWKNTRLHDYSGNSQDQWTDANGMVTLWLPPNEYGRGYCTFAVAGVENVIKLPPVYTTQEFFGDVDLDVPPLTNSTVTIGRVFAQAGHKLSVLLDPDQTGWGNSAQVELDVTGPHKTLGTMPFDDQGAPEDGRSWTVAETGWHTITITSSGLPDAGSPFSLKCTYMGGSM